MAITEQLAGIVQLGDLTAFASWKTEYILSIRFSTRTFTKAQWKAVEHLENCADPVSVRGVGSGSAVKHIIGYESDLASVTFHLTDD